MCAIRRGKDEERDGVLIMIPHNPDNITKKLFEFNLLDYKKLIDMKPLHIATVRQDNKPNLSVASDVLVLDKNKIVVSNNQMIYTPHNIQSNNNVVITSFDKNWVGLRMTGTAEYETSGANFELCVKEFQSDTCTPRGAIVVTVEQVEEIK